MPVVPVNPGTQRPEDATHYIATPKGTLIVCRVSTSVLTQ